MYRLEKTLMRDNPSFSSTLLDKIYRSIDDGEAKNEDLKFYSGTMQKKQKWMEKKVSEKTNADKKQVFSEIVRKSHHEHDLDHDGVFFSSTSISSDSSYGGFSSSDTESMYGTKTKASSCFVPPWPKPVKTRVSAQSDKPLKTGGTGRMEQRAMKIYGNLKKVKQQQPISPGGRLTSFINSLFTTGNAKKPKSSLSSSSSIVSRDDERKMKSSCSSASSFSRSCLSKNSPSMREKLCNGVKRTVRFCPVSVIVDEGSRPCGHKCLYADIIGKSSSRKCEEKIKFQIMEKTRRVEEMAREFLKEYHLNKKKNDLISRDSRRNYVVNDEDEDDASSCSSSDLFELDHLVLFGNHRYEEELPVYETTHVETNRAIPNSLIV